MFETWIKHASQANAVLFLIWVWKHCICGIIYLFLIFLSNIKVSYIGSLAFGDLVVIVVDPLSLFLLKPASGEIATYDTTQQNAGISKFTDHIHMYVYCKY